MAKRMKVAAAAVLTTPDRDGRYTRGLRGDVIEVDTNDQAIKDAIERGHLIGPDDPLPKPSSPAKQAAARTAAPPPAEAAASEPALAADASAADVVDGNADAVIAYAQAHPDRAAELLDAETAGKDRVGVKSALEALTQPQE